MKNTIFLDLLKSLFHKTLNSFTFIIPSVKRGSTVVLAIFTVSGCFSEDPQALKSETDLKPSVKLETNLERAKIQKSLTALESKGPNVFYKVFPPGAEEGLTPSYLMGSKHNMTLDRTSLPSEINTALEKAKMGVIELNPKNISLEQLQEATRQTLVLPKGQTLSMYIGDEQAQEIFNFIQSSLALDTQGLVFDGLKNMFGFDLRDYRNFNQISPLVIKNILLENIKNFPAEEGQKAIFIDRWGKSLKQNPFLFFAEKIQNSPAEDNPEEEVCTTMDAYIERTISQMGKPVHSLEIVKEQIFRSQAGIDYELEAKILNLQFLNMREGKSRPNVEKTDILFNKWNNLLRDQEQKFTKAVVKEYYKGNPVFPLKEKFLNPIKQLATERMFFLLSNRCSVFLDSSSGKLSTDLTVQTKDLKKESGLQNNSLSKKELFILMGSHIDQTLELEELYFQKIFEGKPIDKETENELVHLLKNQMDSKLAVFSTCFPDHKGLEEDLKEKEVLTTLYEMKKTLHGNLLARDPLLAKSLLPFLEEGGAFVLLGFAHLKAILNYLKVQGYEVQPVVLSKSLQASKHCQASPAFVQPKSLE